MVFLVQEILQSILCGWFPHLPEEVPFADIALRHLLQREGTTVDQLFDSLADHQAAPLGNDFDLGTSEL